MSENEIQFKLATVGNPRLTYTHGRHIVHFSLRDQETGAVTPVELEVPVGVSQKEVYDRWLLRPSGETLKAMWLLCDDESCTHGVSAGVLHEIKKIRQSEALPWLVRVAETAEEGPALHRAPAAAIFAALVNRFATLKT